MVGVLLIAVGGGLVVLFVGGRHRAVIVAHLCHR
jgi:hypothetical protein